MLVICSQPLVETYIHADGVLQMIAAGDPDEWEKVIRVNMLAPILMQIVHHD